MDRPDGIGGNMSVIQISNLSFTYPGSYTPVFSNISFSMDTDWRLGLVGRNGRGKTTLLRLLAGELTGTGQIISSAAFDLFPFPVDEEYPALTVLRNAVAPFDAWEQRMEALLRLQTKEALAEWGDIEHRYAAHDGYVIDELIAREADKMGVDPAALERPFLSFSPGERTRMLLASLFLRKNRFLLIDEPTNHLDMAGRDIAAAYLASKQGFLLVSHDRAFLDRSVDHIVALEKADIRVERGTYSSYRHNKQLQDDFERAQNEKLAKDIRRLEASSREKASWSDRVEKTKIGEGPIDRGYIGAKSAKMMKRSLAIQARIARQVEEKEALLKNLEYTAPIKLAPLQHAQRTLLCLDDVCAGYDPQAPAVSNLSLSIQRGDRVALSGCNGSGKSTLLKLMAGSLAPFSGTVSRAPDLALSILPQTADSLIGTPRDIAAARGLDLSHFLMLLRKFDFPREAFDRDARGLSMGQKKKLLITASMAVSAHIYLWDEPLNYIDVESREQIEDMLADTDATMVFVEHDRRVLDLVASRVIVLENGEVTEK